MKIEDDDLLKAWISRDVEPFTDADSEALAKYVIALIKKPIEDDELEKLCLDKLDVFLQGNTRSFVERLFRCLRGGLYLPESSQAGKDSPVNDFDDDDGDVLTEGGGSDLDEEETQSKPTSNPEKKAQSSSSSDKLKSKVVAPETRKQDSSSSRPSVATLASRPPRRRISPPVSSNKQVGSIKEEDKETPSIVPAPSRGHPAANRRGSPPVRGGRGRMGACSRDTRPSGRSDRYHRRQRSWSRSRSRSRSPHRKEKREEHESIRRHRCRDFHEKGFCMRGDKCMYDHGPDPVVIENSALEKIVGRNPGAVPSSTTNVTTAAVYNPMNPPPPGIDNKVIYGASPTTEPYNPEAPGLNAPPTSVSKIDFSVPPPPIPHPTNYYGGPPPTIQPPPYNTQPINGPPGSGLVTMINAGLPATSFNPQASAGLLGVSQDLVNPAPGFYNNMHTGGGSVPFRRGMRGSGRYRPYGGGMASRINPALCSILVKKIPPEQNKIVLLDQHFGKFGQITNLHVQFEGQPDTALVTFKSRREALNAYKSTEPIFNNRFIKVFWQTQPDQPAPGAPDNAEAAITNQSGEAAKVPLPTDLNRNFSKTFGSEQQTGNILQSTTEKQASSAQAKTYDHSAIQPGIPVQSGNGSPSTAGTQTHLKRPVYNPRAVAAKRRSEKESLLKMLELHRLKTDLYTKLFDQQKDLLQKIQANENKEVRKKYMTLVKSTSTSMAATKAEIEKLGEQIKDLQKTQQETAKKPAFGSSFTRATVNGNEQRKSSTAGQEEANENANVPTSPLPLSASTNKKLFKVVHVSGCPVQSNEELIVHMESFGELFDFDIAPRNRASPCVFTYKNPADAQRAVAEASKFPQGEKLKVEWAPVSLGQHAKVIPDKERKPDEQMTPAALLAALEGDDDYDSDNDEEHQNGKEEEELEL